MNVFDEFLMGECEKIEWCFDNRHFIERLKENGINRDFIVDCVMLEEPVSWQHLEGEKYSVVFKAPNNKDYKEIRVVMACKDNSIDLITIMRNDETTTNRQNRQYQSNKRKDIDKKRNKAMLKRKW